jgi:hypothetical protein
MQPETGGQKSKGKQRGVLRLHPGKPLQSGINDSEALSGHAFA